MLMHSPPVAEGWLRLFTAIRQKSKLPGALRELAIMHVAVLNDAPYEFQAHAPIGLREGLTQDQIDSLADWAHADCYDAAQKSVIEYTEAMTRQIRVPEAVFAAVRAHLSDRELVELTATVGGYNLVSRFLEAMQIDHEKEDRQIK
ncbi:MAG: carboxymuconolactone decarboxylase family protein [Betaproteobacteria bacterium]|nr:carboxymuconolactone decarboxylase family protein [Betaproteobacteria bacterium]